MKGAWNVKTSFFWLVMRLGSFTEATLAWTFPLFSFLQIAGMFKIGNSKELPPIPDHLSEPGKDFIRKCLQRDPSQRPTAMELLQHPFVQKAVSLEKSVLSEPLEHLAVISCRSSAKVPLEYCHNWHNMVTWIIHGLFTLLGIIWVFRWLRIQEIFPHWDWRVRQFTREEVQNFLQNTGTSFPNLCLLIVLVLSPNNVCNKASTKYYLLKKWLI